MHEPMNRNPNLNSRILFKQKNLLQFHKKPFSSYILIQIAVKIHREKFQQKNIYYKEKNYSYSILYYYQITK